ncbi:hypothetical protein TNIN_175051 [Trichonephila inaurata madagascariensis]|uniref:Ionotropic glutamate receptor L-glutamate and glycine-binding domain-containing protein n=1 Tax=Trichonephila inaurata madagascariensis TaxID=2747483 RepID=A0A8X7C8T8_9ARAC|nr:hypothetical protein TNIN_175051 [Trichonephila inaurata madagascariensis]
MKSLYIQSRLKVVALTFKNFFTEEKINGKTIIKGVEAKLLECLGEKLNFDFEYFLLSSSESVNSNGTWDGVIGLVQRGEADVRV